MKQNSFCEGLLSFYLEQHGEEDQSGLLCGHGR